MFEKIKTYFTEHPIRKHLLLLLLACLFLIWLIVFGISIYTHHGDFVIVPDFSGQSVKELDKFTDGKGLRYQVIDSVYNNSKEKGSVVAQVPVAGSKVKSGRIVYLTVVSFQPEMIAMPDFKDLSLRRAKSMLETYGLKLRTFRYVPSEFKDAVLDQYYRGAPVKPGTRIIKGASIDLVVGDGLKKDKVTVPFLCGLTLKEATEQLHALSLNVGIKVYEDGDSTNSRIYKQKPSGGKGTRIFIGESVDLWFKNVENYNFDALIEKQKQLQKQDTAR